MWRNFFWIILLTLLTSESFAQKAFDFEVVKTFSVSTPPANIAASRAGRIFISTHQAYGAKYKVIEILANGKTRPYPNETMSEALTGVLGIVVDEKGILWFLDTVWDGKSPGRLIGWDTRNEKLYKSIDITRPVVGNYFLLNDLAVDRKHETVYIAENLKPERSAILVVDLKTEQVRRVLENTQAVRPEDKDIVIDGDTLMLEGKPARIGINPITIDAKSQWLYFGPMSGTALYRIKTKYLRNKKLTNSALEKRVEFYAEKPFSDGMTIDKRGNIYVSDTTGYSIGVIDKKRHYRQLHTSKKYLSWVEGFANAGDRIYATSNKLHLSPAFKGENLSDNAFYLIQFEPLSHASFGR